MTVMSGVSIPRDHRGSTNALRVLWLSPLMRPLARVQAEALRERGIDVLLVTTDQHPESDKARDYELVLDRDSARRRPLAAHRRIREHRPDIVIAELVRDPRWIALAGRAPRIQLVHDERRDDGGRATSPRAHRIQQMGCPLGSYRDLQQLRGDRCRDTA